jgi:hypothetical protein
MAWEAQQLLFQPHPEIIAALRAIPSLEGHVYHIPHLRDFTTTSEEPFAVIFPPEGGPTRRVSRTVIRIPAFPPGGLLIVREFGAPEDVGMPLVNWNCFELTPLDAPSPLGAPPVEQCFADGADPRLERNPPDSLRRAAAALAHRTRTVSAYVGIETWGGDLEYALAWVFDGRSNRATFLRDARDTATQTDPHDPGLPGVLEVTATDTRFIAAGDVLTLTLLHFGVLLRTGYFEPHTSSFPWDRYQIG